MTCNRDAAKKLALAALLGALAAARAATANGQEIEYSQDPNADKRMTLLLKDWDPTPVVHLQTHEVPRAKFYVIDMHNHVNDPGGVHGEEVPPPKSLRAWTNRTSKR